LGSDGFGYATHGGVHHKIPQVGRVVVEEEVEIGANSAVDRATLGETRIGRGSKLDNLVQVGHNVQVGPASILCGQVGVAGSARLGKGVVLGGQVGVGNHLDLGDGVQVAGKSAVFSDAAPGSRLGGIPAIDLGKWRRQSALLARLGQMARRLRAIERRLGIAAGGGAGTGEPEEGGER
jgi:UDP-3-O-[3-hydroxymyristoyl] glucosamine N-acyltransferase